MKTSVLLGNVHESWLPFLTEERQEQLNQIEQQLGDDFTPRKENMLRFFKQDLNQVKVIWLGQDPYFQPEVANGRSFQPDNLESWNQTFKQVSLKNIIRLVHVSLTGVSSYEDIKSYKEILKEREAGRFPIKEPKEWFDSLEQQGVLFLNSSFSCQVNKANSHKAVWEAFSKELLGYIGQQRPDMIWFLWGKEAIAKKEDIKAGVFYESRHPMMCSSKYEDDFLKNECFKQTKNLINWLG